MPKRVPFTINGRGVRCAYCDRVLEATHSHSSVAATRDHWIPACKGGTVRLWACRLCNALKGCMTPAEWLAFRVAHPEWWKRPEFKRGPAEAAQSSTVPQLSTKNITQALTEEA